MKIQKPIFIVGSGRSGTTLFYNILAGHRDLTWFSNYTDKFTKQPWLSKLNYLYKKTSVVKKLRDQTFYPKPSEGFNVWNLFHPITEIEVAGAARPLFESDVKDANVSLMKDTIRKHLKHSNCTRFLNKNIRNTRRSRYLYEIFPDCVFIHIIRDGRAVLNSLLNVSWWRDLPLWFRNDIKTPSQLLPEGKNEALLAAKMWKFEVQRMLMDSKKIPKKQYLEIRYEDFTVDPISIIKNVLMFCDLDYYEDFEKLINSFNILNMNYKWVDNLSKKQIEIIEAEINPLLKKFGYK